MMLEEKTVREVVQELGRNGEKFHTTELAVKLSERLGTNVTTGLARYWTTQMVLKGVLERIAISTRLHVYKIRTAADLSSSFNLRQ